MPNTVESPSPVPRPGRLGREERLENVFERFGIDAFAGIRHAEHDVLAGRDLEILGVGGVEPRAVEEQRQPAARRHGVARVNHQVHDDLLELTGIDQHELRPLGMIEGELHIFADQPLDHRLKLADGSDQVNDPALEDLLPAEREKLLGQTGRALRRNADLAGIAMRRLRPAAVARSGIR